MHTLHMSIGASPPCRGRIRQGLLTTLSLLALPACTPQKRPPTGSPSPVVSPQAAAVTVVPFTVDDPDNGAILLPAELGGRRGIVLLDTGTPGGGLLNRQYVKPNPTGGLDTVLAGEPIPQNPIYVNVPVRIGTLQTPHPVNVVVIDDSGFAQNHRFQSSIGRIGLAGLEPFDAIIDYAHQRLVLIRLDAAGHRLAAVPAYTPTT
ncbi:MAG TPA: hypothetical protein VNU46_03190, partial [Gemmatimonadaceae bacterium]|nr:hypothetical protein [Gemmatimonadaceae bacterium]